MKKIVIMAILMCFSKNVEPFQYSYENNYHWSRYKHSIQFRVQYTQMIKIIKHREGFRPKRYDDKGYDCIGFGQRTKFYPEIIPDSITEEQADLILRKSFYRHLKLVKRKWPKLKDKKLIHFAFLSYAYGVRKIKKFNTAGYEHFIKSL